MSTNVSLETGKLTDSHRTSFRSTTYRVIYKNTNTTTSSSSWDMREIRRKNNDVFNDVTIWTNTAQADDIP